MNKLMRTASDRTCQIMCLARLSDEDKSAAKAELKDVDDDCFTSPCPSLSTSVSGFSSWRLSKKIKKGATSRSSETDGTSGFTEGSIPARGLPFPGLEEISSISSYDENASFMALSPAIPFIDEDLNAEVTKKISLVSELYDSSFNCSFASSLELPDNEVEIKRTINPPSPIIPVEAVEQNNIKDNDNVNESEDIHSEINYITHDNTEREDSTKVIETPEKSEATECIGNISLIANTEESSEEINRLEEATVQKRIIVSHHSSDENTKRISSEVAGEGVSNGEILNAQNQERPQKKRRKKIQPLAKTKDLTVEIQLSQQTANGKRTYDKHHCCLFCRKMVQKPARHMENLHPERVEVAELVALPPKDPRRRHGFSKLIREGDFYHNCVCIRSNEGELILSKRPSEADSQFLTYKDYTPCPYCLGFLLRNTLWKHVKYSCLCVPEDVQSKKNDILINGKSYADVRTESDCLLAFGVGNFEEEEQFRKDVLSEMVKDDAGKLCDPMFKECDKTIYKVGLMLYEKGNVALKETARATMRVLARLLLEIRKLDDRTEFLVDCLCGSKFDYVVQAAKRICKYRLRHDEEDRNVFERPHQLLKIGPALEKAVNVCRGDMLRNFEQEPEVASLLNKKLKGFLALLSTEWRTRLSSTARANTHELKFNKAQLLPLTSDLMKLKKYLLRTREKFMNLLPDYPSYFHYRQVASTTLCLIMLFNRRRSGEASKMRKAQYLDRAKWTDQGTCELRENFTDLEKVLAKKMTLVYTKGKNGDKVAVLIDEDGQKAIDMLLKYRGEAGIRDKNPFVFAVPNKDRSFIRGSQVLRTACTAADLQCPAYVTGTKLRKHVATVSQIFDLNKTELGWLARHLGHELSTHKQYYRLHESAVEVTKISQLLLAMDNGLATQFKGKSLDQIDLEGLPLLDEENGENEASDDESDAGEREEEELGEGEELERGGEELEREVEELEGEGEELGEEGKELGEGDTVENEIPSTSNEGNSKDSLSGKVIASMDRKVRPHASYTKNIDLLGPDTDNEEDKDYEPHQSEEDDDNYDEDDNYRPQKKKAKKPVPGPKFKQRPVPWTDEEKQLLLHYFRKEVFERKRIQKSKIDGLQKKHPIFQKRFWRNIRDYFHWQLKEINRNSKAGLELVASLKQKNKAKGHKKK